MYDRSQVDLFTTAIRTALNDPSVVDVCDHFAGYFDELGIIITVTPETPDEQVRSLKERIAPVLFQSHQPFRWIVMFQRGGKQVGVLFPDGLFTMGWLAIGVEIVITHDPLLGPGRALISASGSYRR